MRGTLPVLLGAVGAGVETETSVPDLQYASITHETHVDCCNFLVQPVVGNFVCVLANFQEESGVAES
jgi:hypothetical protein